MSKYLLLFLNPLILLISFWLFFYNNQGIIWLIIIALATIIISAKIMSQQYFWKFKFLWLNFIIVYIAELLFLLLLTSGEARYILAFILSFIWGIAWLLLKKYFESIRDLNNKDYLAWHKFLYYLGFWFLSTSLYSLVIFLNFKLSYAVIIMLLSIFLLGREIISISEGISKYYIWFVLFLSMQILWILYLLPISFYVAGTIATLWFFFIIDSTVNQLKHFKLYLGIFLVSIFILLATSII